MMPVIAKVGSLMSPDHTITFVLSSVRLDAPCAFVFIATILSARRRADFFVVAPVQHGRVDVGSQAVQVLCDSAACGLPVSSFPNIMAYGITDSEGNQARPFKLCLCFSCLSCVLTACDHVSVSLRQRLHQGGNHRRGSCACHHCNRRLGHGAANRNLTDPFWQSKRKTRHQPRTQWGGRKERPQAPVRFGR